MASTTTGRFSLASYLLAKKLVGNFKNGGREWQPKDEPELVDVHDFPSDAVGKAIPYGVYDVAANAGFVSVGVDHDAGIRGRNHQGVLESGRRGSLSPCSRDVRQRGHRRQQRLSSSRLEASSNACPTNSAS